MDAAGSAVEGEGGKVRDGGDGGGGNGVGWGGGRGGGMEGRGAFEGVREDGDEGEGEGLKGRELECWVGRMAAYHNAVLET